MLELIGLYRPVCETGATAAAEHRAIQPRRANLCLSRFGFLKAIWYDAVLTSVLKSQSRKGGVIVVLTSQATTYLWSIFTGAV
jgi:hypothetical protein